MKVRMVKLKRPGQRLRWTLAALAGLLGFLPETLPAEDAVPLAVPSLQNVFRVTDRILSGSEPEGEAAFAALARLGVKTIVSVDGAKPDVATARGHGLRYIHLPIGYDGVPAARAVEFARVATAQPGAIYVHCQHGKHRGPAAVAVMCEATGGWSRERAEHWLRQAGTAEEYSGLYRAVREFQPATAEQLAQVGELPEVAATPALVDAMVAIEERFDALQAAQKAGWKSPAGRAELAPENIATLLWEHLRELARAEDTVSRPDDYRAKLNEAEKAADALRTSLRRPNPQMNSSAALQQVGERCVDCHKLYRNEKQ
jgi:protein-tyrosine phosphatase